MPEEHQDEQDRDRCQGMHGACERRAEHETDWSGGRKVLCWPCFVFDCTH